MRGRKTGRLSPGQVQGMRGRLEKMQCPGGEGFPSQPEGEGSSELRL